jgi:hypothetical protein
MATPALSAASKTDNGVTFTCALTGSGNSGFDIYAKNDGPSDKVCSASCKLTKSDGKTQEWAYPKQGDPIKVSKASQKILVRRRSFGAGIAAQRSGCHQGIVSLTAIRAALGR